MNITDAKRMLREELDKHELYSVEVKMNNRLTTVFGRYRYSRLYNHKSIELSSKGYSIDDASQLAQAARSFETGQAFLVYNKDGKIVAFYELCSGYYSGANVNIYTGQDLIDISDDGYDTDKEVTKNKRDIERVVKTIQEFTESFKRTATFSNGESIYQRD